MTTGVRIRPMNELDIEGICRIDEKITGRYRPEVWEQRAAYYIRRDPDSSQVAEVDGRVVGFMLGEVRGGEFGLEEPTGWVAREGRWPPSDRSAAGPLSFEGRPCGADDGRGAGQGHRRVHHGHGIRARAAHGIGEAALAGRVRFTERQAQPAGRRGHILRPARDAHTSAPE